jgi:tRNA pseudouridine32 synthase/23S rRNA pseudouridine746 synthase
MMIKDQPQPYIVPHCDKEVKILYQDDDILLIDKPDLLLSVPGRHPLNRDCVITRLREQFPDAHMAHRLDLDTSGIMVIALNKPALVHINRQFAEREVSKSYTAVVYGIVDNDEGQIDLPLIADWPNRPLQKVCHETGKWALTHYTVIERHPEENRTRLLLKPVTGRSHQLRIHLCEIGHPILGCDMYAHKTAYYMADRLLLHATELSLTHPVSGEPVRGYSSPEF